ncbi:MAG: sugar phosphate isomerase/epimerase family protein [Candidatus Altiarchaeota archaeon]|nr:sugar phosphate isomerase/epimerase family protein [Candidatus Altiarchaeota archaeon]
MKIGFAAQIFWDYQKLDLDYVINHAVNDLGFECVEILCQNPMFPGWCTNKVKKTKKEIRDILSTLDVGVSLHAPYHDLNIASWNIGVKNEAIKQVKTCIEVANYLESGIVVVHPGYVASRKYRRNKTFDMMMESFREITKTAEDLDVKLCMENIASKPKAMGVHIQEIKRMVEEVNSENFKLTLDVAHVNTTGLTPKEYIEGLREYIFHVHISDNTGGNDHLPLGLGNIDFEEFLGDLRPYKGFLIIEGWIPRNQDYFLKWDKMQLENIIKKIGYNA